MKYKVINNGSKWYGQPNDKLNDLEKRLRQYAIEDFTTTRKIENGLNIWGNFRAISAVFNIDLFDSELIGKFRGLIYRNRRLTKLGKLT